MSSLLKPKKLLSDDDAKSRFQYKRKKRKADGSTTSKSSQGLRFKGAQMFRMRLVCATLTGKSVRIDDIRLLDENPGLNDYEASFLRLLDSLTNGTAIKINETGTTLRYKPGFLVGGKIHHDCPTSRSIGYFLESLCLLAPFCKKPLQITLTGITNESNDISVDIFRTVTLPLLNRFGVDGESGIGSNLELRIKKRGAAPKGGGEVIFKCPIVKKLNPIQVLDEGKIKRVRGVAYTTRCSPMFGQRLVDQARGVLNNFIPDVFVYTDHYKGKDSGSSPGFALALVAESTEKCLAAAELSAEGGILPEDLGKKVAELLLEEISFGGCVDSRHQSMALLLMMLCPEDVSKIRLGKLTPHTIACLRLFKEAFGVMFKIKPDKAKGNDDSDAHTVILSCLGIGYTNFARQTI